MKKRKPSSQEQMIGLQLRDHLGEQTRRYRRTLLAMSLVCWIVAVTGAVPTEITALGMRFKAGSEHHVAWILAAITLYFLGEFFCHALRDAGVVWSKFWRLSSDTKRQRIIEDVTESFVGDEDEQFGDPDEPNGPVAWLSELREVPRPLRIVAWLQFAFVGFLDFVLPFLAAGSGVWCLLSCEV